MPDLSAEDLYQTYYPRVFAWIYGHLGHRQDAEDVAQDVFVKALQALPSLSVDHLNGWLRVVAANTVRDTIRHRKRIIWSSLDTVTTLPAELCAPDPAAQYDDTSRERVHQALQGLSKQARQALLLVLLEGYTHAECAQLLACSVDSNKTRVSRARRAFQRHYQQISREENAS